MRLRIYVEFTIEGDDPEALKARAEEIGDEIELPKDAADFEAFPHDSFENEDMDDERANGPRR